MNRKITVMFLLLSLMMAAILFYMSLQSEGGVPAIDNKPPMPNVTYDDKKVEVHRGSYGWDTGGSAVMADYAAPYDIIQDKNPTEVKLGDSLNFAFPYTPKKAVVRIWQDEEVLHASSNIGIVTAPKFEGIYAVEIYAEWKEGHGSYVIKLEVKDENGQ